LRSCPISRADHAVAVIINHLQFPERREERCAVVELTYGRGAEAAPDLDAMARSSEHGSR